MVKSKKQSKQLVLYSAYTRVSQSGPRHPLEATVRFSGGHELRPLLNSCGVMLQNPIDEQGATSVESLWKWATKHERLRTIDLHRQKLAIACQSRNAVGDFGLVT